MPKPPRRRWPRRRTPDNRSEQPCRRYQPCLWFNGEAEEAANFYVSLLPGSKIENVARNSTDGPGGKAGSVLVVEFTVAGQRFMALNGGMKVEYTHAVSFKIDCADQAEVDRLWDALLANGGKANRCGWLNDRYGVSWQIVPTDAAEIYRRGRQSRRGARDAGDARHGQARHRRAEEGV